MDLWVVAAAAGAGYLGKYWKNLSLSEKERLLLSSSSRISTQRSSESWNFLQQIRDRTCPLKRLRQEKALQGGIFDTFAFENASTIDTVKMVEDFNAEWLRSLPKFTKETSCRFCSSEMQKCLPLLATGDGDDHMKESFDLDPLDQRFDMRESEVKPSHISCTCFTEEASSDQSSKMVLFLIGLAIGMLSTESNRELQEMNEKLDQAMNLVQDLKEELDMKDSFSVRELCLSTSEQEPKMEKLQLMSTIEAELEAELERLQMDMEQERTSTFFQVNAQSEGTITETEFDERSDTNYAVSPHELRIRLHELIESQLEARIKELETTLEINQNIEKDAAFYHV